MLRDINIDILLVHTPSDKNWKVKKARAKELNIKLIHISTDYVFDGKNFKPYCEEFQTNPNSIYGQTKLDGENEMININPSNSIIIRTSWVYSYYGNNFVKTMLRLVNTHNELSIAVGTEGRSNLRNAPTILNVALLSRFFHDAREHSLENQVWGPLLSHEEMANPSPGYLIKKIKNIRKRA